MQSDSNASGLNSSRNDIRLEYRRAACHCLFQTIASHNYDGILLEKIWLSVKQKPDFHTHYLHINRFKQLTLHLAM
jgi:hypothetical protein